ncbi:type 1 glutamine amidotransferase [Puerhibacterium puerhi]|uniref:type 1 glutamine amidotransferase n=1 Tax=Puerhibacterium puerhi TaxID=2692623 RepID=UPI001359E5E5|nr:type 1 glutamine amidotransferase [Puerhibacterium puerhi]
MTRPQTHPTTSPQTRPHVVLVQNTARSRPARLPGWLADEQVDVTVVQGPDLPDRLADLPGPVDGIVLLGGGLMPDDDARAPFLARERALTREAIAAGVPLLGICLGAQLVAAVTGGRVTPRSGETERGSCAITLLDAAAADPVFGGLAGHAELRMIENHRDSITALPPGAVHLATSPACRVQAFRLGDTTWGVQFHPEVPAERLATWDESDLAAGGFDRAALLEAARADAPVNTAQARALVGGFAAVVRAAAAARAAAGPGTGERAASGRHAAAAQAAPAAGVGAARAVSAPRAAGASPTAASRP